MHYWINIHNITFRFYSTFFRIMIFFLTSKPKSNRNCSATHSCNIKPLKRALLQTTTFKYNTQRRRPNSRLFLRSQNGEREAAAPGVSPGGEVYSVVDDVSHLLWSRLMVDSSAVPCHRKQLTAPADNGIKFTADINATQTTDGAIWKTHLFNGI